MKVLKNIAAMLAVVTFLTIVLLGLSFIDSLASSGRSNIKPGIWWNAYHATGGGWDININESENVNEPAVRMVHLTSITNSSCGITGHGDMNGNWHRIFWGGFPSSTNGFNSYVRTKRGWKWEPCSSDKDMAPIPQSEIPKAIALLNAAMTNRRIENVIVLWTRGGTTDLVRK